MKLLLTIIAVALPVLGLLHYIYSHDKIKPEPVRMLFLTFLAGNVWLDQKQIVDGDYEKRIVNGIENSAYFMPIVTKEYILKHRPIFNSYKSIEDIVNDSKLEFVQMETLIAEKFRKELQRIAYSLPIVIPSPIGESGALDFDMIEKKYAESYVLPGSLFRRQQMFYYADMFDGKNDWSQYKSFE